MTTPPEPPVAPEPPAVPPAPVKAGKSAATKVTIAAWIVALAVGGGYAGVKLAGNPSQPSASSTSDDPTAGGETSPTVELPPPTQADLINVKYNDYTDEQRAILEQPIRKTETENRTAEEAGASFFGIYSGILNSGMMDWDGAMCQNSCQHETEESQATLEKQLVAAFGPGPYSESVQGVIEQARDTRLAFTYNRYIRDYGGDVDKSGDKFWAQSSAQLISSTSVDDTTTILNYHYTRDNNIDNYSGAEARTKEAHVEQDVTITMQLGADGVWRPIEMV